MDSLIRGQRDVGKRIENNHSNFKKSPKARLTASYIETRMVNLEQQWMVFNEVHRKLICDFSEEEQEESDYFVDDYYGVTEELYTEYKSDLMEGLKKFSGTVNQASSETSNGTEQISVHLPKIAIPSFSGKYSEWTTFRDLFLSLIHNNKSLQKVQKLHYLKSYLTGEAEQLVRHLQITSDNYSVCWDLLENRFDNKKYVTNCILDRFFGQKNILHENSNAIKEMFDTTNDCLNALQNVGIQTENWDILIIYVLASRLDSESRKLWETKTCNINQLPTLAKFLEFLEHRFRSLEFLISKPVNNHKSLNSPQSHYVVLNTNVHKVCSFCTNTNHKLGNCKLFANENLPTRRTFVQTSKLCYNCLGANHLVTSCRLPTRCRICRRKHHSLLHSNNQGSFNNLNATGISNDGDHIVAATAAISTEKTNITTCFSNNKSQVLLPTALVNAETANGSTMTLRSIVDQGSTATFIKESTVRLLGLKKVQSKSVISGVGSDRYTLKSDHLVYIKLQSIQDPSYTINVKAHVLNNMSSVLPESKFRTSYLNIPNLVLADPNFNIPGKVDLLLGGDVYSEIVTEGLVRGSSGSPIAQNTKLGWILSGKIGT